jgi:glyoxylase-like metal-dependent hydrolase (beta-lactamase superfamily II)
VTHLHPDHIGLARWLEERSGAPVFMLEREIQNARHVWDSNRGTEDFVRYLLRNGMEAETAEPTAGSTRLGVRLPERLIPLRHGDLIELGGGEARVVHTPGHSDFHFVLHDARRRLLFAGDHLLLKITPNIGLCGRTRPRDRSGATSTRSRDCGTLTWTSYSRVMGLSSTTSTAA